MPGQYRVLGRTNYECYEGLEQDFGVFKTISEALPAFKKYVKDEKALDFSFLDEEISEWIANDKEGKLDLNDGCYGGSVDLLYELIDEKGEAEERFQILTAYRGRDPYTKELWLNDYEKGDDFNEFYNQILDKDCVELTSCLSHIMQENSSDNQAGI